MFSRASTLAVGSLFALALSAPHLPGTVQPSTPRVAEEPASGGQTFIVRGPTLDAARDCVNANSGEVVRPLSVIAAVEARVDSNPDALLTCGPDIQVTVNRAVQQAGNATGANDLVGAHLLHDDGIVGSNVTIAIVDSGIWERQAVKRDIARDHRILARYDAHTSTLRGQDELVDDNGHGSHVTSVMVNSNTNKSGRFRGIAPDARLVVVKALDAEGSGSYADVIDGIGWVVANRHEYDIRVLNLSLSAPVVSHYWDDPLNQAVMAAWDAGIVVVAAAGNYGPDAMSIGVPGNVPYVITVGAMTDSYTPDDPTDDRLASFSSAGPTYEGFVKPEVVAPGGHLTALLPTDSYLSDHHPEYRAGTGAYFEMSGTSQSSAVVSGIAALILQSSPDLSPDAVKCRIMASSRLALDDGGVPMYSVFQQGAGMVSAYDAVHSTASNCANQGLDIAADLAGTQHFGGLANVTPGGEYYIMDPETGEQIGSDAFLWSNGFLWSNAFLWSNGFLWSNAFLWSNGFLWSNAFLWSNTYAFPASAEFGQTATTASANVWVDQE